ncbi:hypothetical protein PF003_g32640 [Phytophthora fragariae]|nr:hypothetical protein PF003_g32640 [Phytophthora fragariae]
MNFSCSTVPDGKTSVLMQEVTKRKEQLYADTGSTTQAATTATTEERDDLAACMPMTELRLKYRPIFRKDAVPTCLGRRKRLNELKLVNKDVFESAFVDVMTEVQASRASSSGSTFPVLDLRSDRARSGAINFATTKLIGFNLTEDGGKHYTRFH